MVELAIVLAIGALLFAGALVFSTYKMYKLNEKVQSGELGDGVKWANELAQEDAEFKEAMRDLPKGARMAMGAIADSKEELRRLVIEFHRKNQ